MPETIPAFEVVSLVALADRYASIPVGQPLPAVRAVRTDADDAWLAVAEGRIIERRRDRAWRRFATLDAIQNIIEGKLAPAANRQSNVVPPSRETPVASLESLAALYAKWPREVVAPEVTAIRTETGDEWYATVHGLVIERRRDKTRRRFTTLDAVYSLIAAKFAPTATQQIRLNVQGSVIPLIVDVVPIPEGKTGGAERIDAAKARPSRATVPVRRATKTTAKKSGSRKAAAQKVARRP